MLDNFRLTGLIQELYGHHFGIIAFSIEDDGLTLDIELPPINEPRQGIVFSACSGPETGKNDAVSLFLERQSEDHIAGVEDAVFLDALPSTADFVAIESCAIVIEDIPIGEYVLYIRFNTDQV